MRQKRVLSSAVLAAAAAVLIAMGLVRVVRVYESYREDMLTYESRHLDSIVSSSARGLDWALDGYAAQAGFLARELARAETAYAAGDAAAMRRLVKTTGAAYLFPGCTAAAYDGSGAFIASSSPSFPARAGQDEELGAGMAARTDADGVFWFVFTARSEGGFAYELAVPVQTTFADNAAAARVGRHGYLFLLDAQGRFIGYSTGGQSGVMSVAALLESEPALDADALAALAARPQTAPEDYLVFRYPWPGEPDGTRADERTLVVTSPLRLGGGALVLGAALSFGEFDVFITDTLREVALVICLELGGAFLLFYLAAQALTLSRRNALELEAMRQRAELMEEINRQQQSLEHTERLQQLGVMTSGMVHEFNNLLTPIMGQSMLLLEQLADEEASPRFESALDIYEASENARDILRRMSDLGKKDVDMRFSTLPLGEVLQKTLALASMAKKPRVRVEADLPEALWVEGNERLLVQALLNLCINACQAMGEDGTLGVRAYGELRSGRTYAVTEVYDTGPGIPEESIGSVFESYYTTKGEQGTGLGLAICQKIIQLHKGTISAANRPGGGAVFTVRLPACEPPAALD